MNPHQIQALLKQHVDRFLVRLRPNSNVEEEEEANAYESLADALRRLSPRVRISSSSSSSSPPSPPSEFVTLLTLKYLPSPAHALAAPNLVNVIGEAFNAAAAGAGASAGTGTITGGEGGEGGVNLKFSNVCFLGGSAVGVVYYNNSRLSTRLRIHPPKFKFNARAHQNQNQTTRRVDSICSFNRHGGGVETSTKHRALPTNRLHCDRKFPNEPPLWVLLCLWKDPAPVVIVEALLAT
ncbi:hypothetical protein B0H13DRAFT_2544218 [Mycena leptocephala]|nr:hypothetical protein B0H13DRAFT_2544218 [Mycena leptocephala]